MAAIVYEHNTDITTTPGQDSNYNLSVFSTLLLTTAASQHIHSNQELINQHQEGCDMVRTNNFDLETFRREEVLQPGNLHLTFPGPCINSCTDRSSCELQCNVGSAIINSCVQQQSVSGDNQEQSTAPPPVVDSNWSQHKMEIYSKAAVSSDSQECSEVGKEILMRGGSAMDAAIATLLCVGVVNAHSMGLGGGFLMTVYNRENSSAQVIDAREIAPINATEDMFQGNLNLTLRGGLPIAVPGELLGYWEAHRRYGRLSWSELFQPAIRICREGHVVGFHMANALRVAKDMILSEPSMREVYVDPRTGNIYQTGDVIRRPTLANTLEIIAERGAEELYTGELAKMLVNDIQQLGGIITMEDLRRYKPLVKEPISVKLSGDMTLYSSPPPGSGSLMALILNILDGYKFNETNFSTPEKTILTLHQFVEACKFSYACRTRLGDERFVDIKQYLKNITSKEYAESVRSRIVDNMTFDTDYYGAVLYQPDDHGTAHVSVVAPNGDAVSVTSSINHYFGAKVRSTSTGIILNDEMGDFSAPNITNTFGVPPSPANFIQPGKRPLSSMCPAIFVDHNGDVRLVIGAAGGTRITSATAMISARNLWMNQDLKTAIDAKRVHHQLLPSKLMYEKGFHQTYLDGLIALGHEEKMYDTGGPIVVAVSREDGHLYAYSDARKGGGTAGY